VPELAIQDASVVYQTGGVRCNALKSVSVAFEPGTLTLVIGPSGSGKTTLLSLLGCLLQPDQGSVTIGGRDVTGLSESERADIRRQHIGFVFQSFRLFRCLTAEENVALMGDINGTRASTATRARTLLEQLGMGGKESLKPEVLSGGEKQRVAIARALLTDPSVVLADEPTASLDSDNGSQILELLHSLAVKQRRTLVVVSHDPRWASFAHRVVELRDGSICEDRKT
jgi:putative ABC transport system ATP-binding protein